MCPTNDNRVLMLKATDEEGNVLPEFEKVLDIDIKAAAEAALGKTLDQNLLSVVFDYEEISGLQQEASAFIPTENSRNLWLCFTCSYR